MGTNRGSSRLSFESNPVWVHRRLHLGNAEPLSGQAKYAGIQKLKDMKRRLSAYTFSKRLAITVGLTCAFSILVRPAPLLAIVFFLATLASVTWLIVGAFVSQAKFTELGYKSSGRFKRISALLFLVPALLIASAAIGSGIGLAIKPYSAQEIAQQKAQDIAREAERNTTENSNIASTPGRLAELEGLISEQFPNCKFEGLVVKTGQTYEMNADETSRVWLASAVTEMDFVFEKDANGKDNLNLPSKGVTFKGPAKELDFRICNTKGRTLSSLDANNSFKGKSLEEDTGHTYCWIPGRAPTSAEKKIMQKCESRVEANSKLGFWLGIHEFASASEAKKWVIPLLELEWQYGYGSFPLLFADKFVIFASGPFDESNQATVDELNLGWNQIAITSKAKNPADFADKHPDLTDYPTSFDRSVWPKFQTKASEGSRIDLENAYAKLSKYLTCNNKLVASELDFNIGACGKLKVEVFQSDLNTGECNFLAHWTDSNGQSRIGVFEYCDAFSSGSVVESRNYTIKVRISGTTSYTTKLGYQNEVLSFVVIG